jgi:predicted TIM-barrel fold metal-dependent hydrolase
MSYNAEFHAKITGHDHTALMTPVVDAHLHWVDFLQESDGLPRLLAAMDAGGVTKAVVCGLPVRKKWEAYERHPPHYYLDDNAPCYYVTGADERLSRELRQLPAKARARLAPLVCGFNPTDRYAARELERTLDRDPFWCGVGEILCRHDDLTNLIRDEVARMNHPALDDVYALCARRGLPVLVHQNSTSVSIHDEYEHLHELTETLERFPTTRFVWAHCGISRRVSHKHYHEMVHRVLARYPNLWVDIAWVVYDKVICSGLEPKRHWLELIERFPDRFCLGSDLCGHFDHLGKALARYNGLLARLAPKTRHLVAEGNAERLWFLPAGRG